MSRQIPRLVGLIALLLVSGIDVGMANTARADDCLTEPKSPAPQGTHWYYHVDRTNQRKCWYVRAPGQPAQQAVAQATSEAAPAAQSHSMPASATTAGSAPMSISPGDSAPPLPHARILTVKPKLVANKSVQGSGQEGSTGSSIPEVSAPEPSTSLQTNARAAGPAPAAPAAWPDALPTVVTVGAPEPSAVPTDAGAESVPKTDTQAPAESTTRGGDPTINAGMVGSLPATLIVLILALGLAAAGTVSRVVMKIAAARRASVMIDHPESDRVDDQWQPERRNDQEQGFVYDQGFVDEPLEDEPVISAVNNYESLHPSRAGDAWQENALGEGGASQMNEISEDTLAQLSRDLHKALLADGSWPRNMTARAHEARRHGGTAPARGASVAGRVRSLAS
jgi:hypothetical protein